MIENDHEIVQNKPRANSVKKLRTKEEAGSKKIRISSVIRPGRLRFSGDDVD